MTRVLVENSGTRCALSAKGHATGSETVCAAVSGILYALAGYLVNAAEERYVEIYEYRVESGDVKLDFCGDERAEAAFEMAMIGLRQLEQGWPGLVRVETRDLSRKS